MSKKKGWGGARPHPPGREGGRPRNKHKLRILKIACTEEELKAILARIPDTRKRAEILLKTMQLTPSGAEEGE